MKNNLPDAHGELCDSGPNIKNGTEDHAVMSIEELLTGKLELYSLLDEGLEQVKNGKTKPMKESMKSIRENLSLMY
jgi:hypothetical protein